MVDGSNKRFVADMVRANYLANWSIDMQGLRQICSNYAGPISQIDWVRDIPNECNLTIVETAGTFFIFAGGIADQIGRERILSGWNDPLAADATSGFNPWAFNLFDLRLRPMIYRLARNLSQVVFVGQSAGGLMAEVSSYIMFGRADRPQDITILTGTPRGLHQDGPGVYSTGTFWRFMLLNDPVVSLPPRFHEWPEMCLLFSPIVLPYTVAKILSSNVDERANFVFNWWPGWRHPPGGIILSDDGYSVASHDLPPPRAAGLVTFTQSQTIHNIFSYRAHEMLSYVSAVDRWGVLNFVAQKTTQDEPGETSGGNWGQQGIEFFCPADDAGNIVFSPNGRVQVAANIIQTGSVPAADGSIAGALYLRGQHVATFPTVGKARTAASKLNKFLARLPIATEVSTGGLTDGILQYLSEAAIGGGVDRRPVKVVT